MARQRLQTRTPCTLPLGLRGFAGVALVRAP